MAAAHGALLRKWCLERGLKRTEAIAELKKLGVEMGYSYLAKLESDARPLAGANLQVREGLRRIYRITPHEWQEATGLHLPLVTGPALEPATTLHRTVSVFELDNVDPHNGRGRALEVITVPASWKGDHTAYRVSDDSMAPEIPAGAVVVVRDLAIPRPGQEIAAYVPGRGALVRHLERITPEGEYVLTGYHPAARPLWAKELVLLGVVVEVRARRALD